MPAKLRHRLCATVPGDVLSEFQRVVRANGYPKEQAVSGALKMFIASDPSARASAIRVTERKTKCADT